MSNNNFKNTEDELGKWVSAQEQESSSNSQPQQNSQKPSMQGKTDAQIKLEKAAEANRQKIAKPLYEAQAEANEQNLEQTRLHGLGFLPIPVESLPTQGLFYQPDIKIMVRAATGNEIRHWSTINDEDINDVDDQLNYILERCMNISYKESNRMGNWKDLTEIDRLYLILAIRDFTFTEGNNELKIVVSEGKTQVVNKDNINFIKLPEKLMEHYSETERCFIFKTKNPKNPELRIYMPTVGVSTWLKNYVRRKSERREGFDRDFVTIAPLLIQDYRGLNDAAYEGFLTSCFSFGVYEYTLIAKIKDMIQKAITPEFVYVDEDGAEQTSPLNFQGGFKGLFLLNLDDVL